MRTRTVRLFIVFIYLSLIFVALAGISSLLARPATRVDPTKIADDIRDLLEPDRLILVISNESPFKPTSLCRQCHRNHDDQWTDSQHFRAWRNPVFQRFYSEYLDYLASPEVISEETYEIITGEEFAKHWTRSERMERLPYLDPDAPAQREVLRHGMTRTYKEYLLQKDPLDNEFIRLTGQEISQVIHGEGLLPDGIIDGKVQINCLRCHAPGADLTMDRDMLLENNTDGVFCDYCHLVVDRTDDVHYLININSNIKQGPHVTAVTSQHAIEPSKLHTQSEFCKSCHQYENPLGVGIYNTYNEWYHSDYNTGVHRTQCQTCHMPKYEGRAARNSDVRPNIADHTFYGGYHNSFLLHCATVDIDSIIETDQILLDVSVTNARAGHNLPADSPLRQLVLIVRLKGPEGETLWSGRRVYQRVWGDLEGNPTFNHWEAAQILSDTTLGAHEKRVENFTVPRPDIEGSVYVTAQLFYRLTPEGKRVTEYIPRPFRIDNAVHFIQ